MLMKPDEVKHGLLVHSTSICDDDCPYFGLNGCGVYCSNEMCGDALSLIKQLESKLNQAVEDIRMLGRMGQNICPVCAHHNHGEGSKEHCITCIINRDTDNFEWRGMKKDEPSP